MTHACTLGAETNGLKKLLKKIKKKKKEMLALMTSCVGAYRHLSFKHNWNCFSSSDDNSFLCVYLSLIMWLDVANRIFSDFIQVEALKNEWALLTCYFDFNYQLGNYPRLIYHEMREWGTELLRCHLSKITGVQPDSLDQQLAVDKWGTAKNHRDMWEVINVSC